MDRSYAVFTLTQTGGYPPDEPQRHRDTERSTEKDIANTKTQRHEGHSPIAICPQITQITQMAVFETQAGAEVPTVVERRPGTGGQGTDSDRARSSSVPCPPACALGAQASPLLLPCCWMDGTTPPKQEKSEAEPTRPGRVGRWEARRRRTLASGVDVLSTGSRRSPDRRRFRHQSTVRPIRFGEIPPCVSALSA